MCPVSRRVRDGLCQPCGAGGFPPPVAGGWPFLPPFPEVSLQQLWLPVTKAGAPAASGLGTGGQNSVRMPRAQPKPATRAASPDPPSAGRPSPGRPGSALRCRHEGGAGSPRRRAARAALGLRYCTDGRRPAHTRARRGRSPEPCFAAQGTRLHTRQQSDGEKNSVKSRHRYTRD